MARTKSTPAVAVAAAATRNNATTKKKETWSEPKPKWGKSKARKLLYKDIFDGTVPIKAKDDKGKFTAKLADIYNSREEFKQYHYSKFSSRLGALRKTVADKLKRKALDQEAYDRYLSNHEVALFSHKGYIQWQGSDAQALALEHMEQNLHNTTKWAIWHGDYAEFYGNFPLKEFKDKIRQEIRTAKYLHTLEVRGKDTRKTKDLTNEPVEGEEQPITAQG